MSPKQNSFDKIIDWDRLHVFHPYEDFEKFGLDKDVRFFCEHASGIYVTNHEGKRLIDGPAGMWCMQLGYGRGEIADAMAEQARAMAYCSPFTESNSRTAELAHAIAERAPGDLNTVFFSTGGSTAVDSALRFIHFRNNVLGKPEKKKIISRIHAYHGSTYLTASMSGKPKERIWLDTDDQLVHFLPDVNPFNRPAGQSVEAFCDEKVADLENAILALGPEHVAVFVAEPVMASGGVIVPPEGYHKRCLDVCRQYDVLYLSDEVVTGFGRCGHWFASESVFGIVPDIITAAKGLTSGIVPMGATIISDRLLKDMEGEKSAGKYYSGGYTYSGHPVCAAAALKNIEIFEKEGILEHVRKVTPHFRARLEKMLDYPLIVDARGVGLIGCLQSAVHRDGEESKEINDRLGEMLDGRCQELGLILRPYGNLAIFSPPLIITTDEIDQMFDILEQGVKDVTAALIAAGVQIGPPPEVAA